MHTIACGLTESRSSLKTKDHHGRHAATGARRFSTSGRVVERVLFSLVFFMASFSTLLTSTMEITILVTPEKEMSDVRLVVTKTKDVMNTVGSSTGPKKSKRTVPPVQPPTAHKKPAFSPRNYSVGMYKKIQPWYRNTTSSIIDIDDPILTPYISWDNSPVVLEDFRLLFFTTPKIGSTVFKQLFRRMMKIQDWLMDDGFLIPHSPMENGLKYLYDFPTERVEAILTDPMWTRAIFTRDPMERILSAYLDKGAREDGAYIKKHCCGINGKRNVWKKQVVVANSKNGQIQRAWMTKQDQRQNLEGVPMGVSPPSICAVLNATTPVSWEAFVLELLPNCTADEHWKSQVSPALRWINFVGRFDHLAADTRRMLERVGAWEDYGATGWPGGAIFETNFVRHKTSSQSYFDSYYANLRIRQAIHELYRKDYDHALFNHTAPHNEAAPMERVPLS